jgi:hypothetical protein
MQTHAKAIRTNTAKITEICQFRISVKHIEAIDAKNASVINSDRL